jgi:hypothetical protein
MIVHAQVILTPLFPGTVILEGAVRPREREIFRGGEDVEDEVFIESSYAAPEVRTIGAGSVQIVELRPENRRAFCGYARETIKSGVNKLSQTEPHRVQLSRQRGWRMPANTVKVCRPGPWGNPYKVGKGPNEWSAQEAVKAYEKDLKSGRLKDAAGKPMIERLPELAGKNLACWCALNAPCHADVLLTLAE